MNVGRLVTPALLALSVAAHASAEVHLTLRPVLGEGCLARTSPTELIATVENPLAVPLVGTLRIDHSMGMASRVRTLRAVQVSVGPRARAEVHITTADIVPGNNLLAVLLGPRGQVIASTKLVTYEVTLKEIGYAPDAFAIADGHHERADAVACEVAITGRLWTADGAQAIHEYAIAAEEPGARYCWL